MEYIPILNRKCIFKGSIFHYYVSHVHLWLILPSSPCLVHLRWRIWGHRIATLAAFMITWNVAEVKFSDSKASDAGHGIIWHYHPSSSEMIRGSLYYQPKPFKFTIHLHGIWSPQKNGSHLINLMTPVIRDVLHIWKNCHPKGPLDGISKSSAGWYPQFQRQHTRQQRSPFFTNQRRQALHKLWKTSFNPPPTFQNHPKVCVEIWARGKSWQPWRYEN